MRAAKREEGPKRERRKSKSKNKVLYEGTTLHTASLHHELFCLCVYAEAVIVIMMLQSSALLLMMNVSMRSFGVPGGQSVDP